MTLSAVLATIAAGYLGSALIGTPLNGPDTGAPFAAAAMGAFLLHTQSKRNKKSRLQADMLPL